jgi:hypothetical protein
MKTVNTTASGSEPGSPFFFAVRESAAGPKRQFAAAGRLQCGANRTFGGPHA